MKDKDTQLLQEQYSKLFEQEEDVVVVTNQEEWDVLDKQSGKTVEIDAENELLITSGGNLKIIVKYRNKITVANAFIIATEDSRIDAFENNTIYAKDYSEINSHRNNKIFAEDNAQVVIRGRGDTYIEAEDNVEIVIWGKNNTIMAQDNVSIINYSSKPNTIKKSDSVELLDYSDISYE